MSVLVTCSDILKLLSDSGAYTDTIYLVLRHLVGRKPRSFVYPKCETMLPPITIVFSSHHVLNVLNTLFHLANTTGSHKFFLYSLFSIPILAI